MARAPKSTFRPRSRIFRPGVAAKPRVQCMRRRDARQKCDHGPNRVRLSHVGLAASVVAQPTAQTLIRPAKITLAVAVKLLQSQHLCQATTTVECALARRVAQHQGKPRAQAHGVGVAASGKMGPHAIIICLRLRPMSPSSLPPPSTWTGAGPMRSWSSPQQHACMSKTLGFPPAAAATASSANRHCPSSFAAAPASV